MNAMQGGVVAVVADAAAEHALRAATGEPLVVSDLHVTYLGFGRVGPVRSRVDVLDVGDGYASGTRRRSSTSAPSIGMMTTVNVMATRGLA